MKSKYKTLGDYIQEVKVRNTDMSAKDLLGINIDKFFMPSVANIVGTDLSAYRVVKKNQFACNRMHVGRDYRIPISLSRRDEPFMVSPAYDVFEIKDTEALDPEFLMMWFSRAEYDRNAWFYTDADVRGGLPWKAFADMKFPLLSPSEQKSLVAEYKIIQDRINQNHTVIQKLEETSRTIYKEWFVTNLDDSWETKKLIDIAEIKAGGDKPSVFSEVKTEKCPVPIYANGVTNEGLYGFTDKAIYPQKSITISARGTIGYCVLRNEPFVAIVRLLVVMPFNKYESSYLIENLRKIDFDDSGSVQSQLTIPQVSSIEIVMPPEKILRKYDLISSRINEQIEFKKYELKKLNEFKNLLLAKMASA